MSKRFLIAGAALLILALLAGCQMVTRTNIDFDEDSFSKAQRIVIWDTAGKEKAVLEGEGDINAFVEAVRVDGWKLAALPEDLTGAGSFTLWQQETITALVGEGETRVNEICTFHIYEDGDYLTIETGVMDISFSIPKSAADHLRSLTEG